MHTKKVGSILTGIFAENAVIIMGGDAPMKGGWVNQNVRYIFI